MLHLNAKLRSLRGSFSRRAMQDFLTDPELYLAENVNDIKLHSFKKTGYKLFTPGKELIDKSVIYLPSCFLESLKESKDGVTKESTTAELRENAELRDKQASPPIHLAPNASISDGSGKLSLLCPFKIEEFKIENETKLGKVLIFYYHRLGIYRLEHSDQTPTTNKVTLDVLKRLDEILNIKEV